MDTLKNRIESIVAEIMSRPENYNVEDVTNDIMEEIINHINR